MISKKSGLFIKYKQAAPNKTSGVFSTLKWQVKGRKKVFEKVLLTSAIKACCDGVQKGVLRGQEALHHRHCHPGMGSPTAGWRSHHPRGTVGGFYGGLRDGGKALWGQSSRTCPRNLLLQPLRSTGSRARAGQAGVAHPNTCGGRFRCRKNSTAPDLEVRSSAAPQSAGSHRAQVEVTEAGCSSSPFCRWTHPSGNMEQVLVHCAVKAALLDDSGCVCESHTL